jgi:endonuclease YncB( thermonuclease family)
MVDHRVLVMLIIGQGFLKDSSQNPLPAQREMRLWATAPTSIRSDSKPAGPIRTGKSYARSRCGVVVDESLAAEIVERDGDTFQLDRMIYRLDGIDAPEIDQTCLDQSGDLWPCGVTARDRLSAYIGNRAVRCEDKGPDPVYKHRRIGICSIESEATTLNEWLVREGWAIKSDADAKGRFASEETDARENRRGLWKGCFPEPRDLHRRRLSSRP